MFLKYIFVSLLFYNFGFVHSYGSEIFTGKDNLPFLALTSSEVKKVIGVYKSSEDIDKIAQITFQRGQEVCAYYDSTLLDFKVKGEDSKQYVNYVKNEKVEVVELNDSLDFLTIGFDAALFVATGGLSTLLRAGITKSAKVLGVEAGFLGTVAGITEMIEDADLTDMWSYNFLLFEEITCAESSGEIQNVSLAGRVDKKDFNCKEEELSELQCNRLININYQNCYKALLVQDFSKETSIDRCETALSSLKSKEQEKIAVAGILNPDINIGSAIYLASIEEWTPIQAQLAALAISKISEGFPYNILSEVRSVENKLQLEIAIAGISNPNISIKNAIHLAAQEWTPVQSKLAVFTLTKTSSSYLYVALSEILKVENELQLEVAIAGISNPNISIKDAIYLAIQEWTPVQAKMAIYAIDKTLRSFPYRLILQALKIENELQMEVAISGISNPKIGIEAAISLAIKNWTPEQAKVALTALSKTKKSYPLSIIEASRKIKNKAQAEAAILLALLE